MPYPNFVRNHEVKPNHAIDSIRSAAPFILIGVIAEEKRLLSLLNPASCSGVSSQSCPSDIIRYIAKNATYTAASSLTHSVRTANTNIRILPVRSLRSAA